MQQEDPKANRTAASFEEIAYSNMIVVEALVELLDEKGLLTLRDMKAGPWTLFQAGQKAGQ